jgi:hypothetical protein
MSGNLNRLDPAFYATWPTPDYENPERRSWMPIYAGVLQGASSLIVVTRLILRARNKAGPLGLDDVCVGTSYYCLSTPLTTPQALLLPGWLAAIAFTVFTLLASEKFGSGTRVWDVPIPWFEPLAKCGWALQVTFLISTGCTKCSILLFYRRLTKGTYNKRWIIGILAAIAATAAYSLVFIFMLIFACNPTEAYWKSFNLTYLATQDFKCGDTRYANILSGALSIASDLWSVLLPCMMLRNFDAPRRQKIALNCIFCLGLLVVAAGSVRTYYLEKLGHTLDLTWVGFDVYIWAQLEIQLSLICASAPALRALFRTYLSGSMMRALSSARSHNRRESRRQSKRLPGESSDSSRGKSPIPMQPLPGGEKVGATVVASSSQEELNAGYPMRGESEKSMDDAGVQADVDYDLKDLEAASITRPLPIHYVRSSEQIFVPEGGLRNDGYAGHAAGGNF